MKKKMKHKGRKDTKFHPFHICVLVFLENFGCVDEILTHD